MSQGKKIPLEQAESYAKKLVGLLAPACQRIQIAGSIRRRKPMVGDIEIVAIPKMMRNLFGDEEGSQLDLLLGRLASEGVISMTRGGSYFKQFQVPEAGCKLDLFLCDHTTWGIIFTQRTGSSTFSHRLVTPRDRRTSDGHYGLLPTHLRVSLGRIWNGELCLETPEEEDVFRVAQIDWIPPEQRS